MFVRVFPSQKCIHIRRDEAYFPWATTWEIHIIQNTHSDRPMAISRACTQTRGIYHLGAAAFLHFNLGFNTTRLDLLLPMVVDDLKDLVDYSRKALRTWGVCCNALPDALLCTDAPSKSEFFPCWAVAKNRSTWPLLCWAVAENRSTWPLLSKKQVHSGCTRQHAIRQKSTSHMLLSEHAQLKHI